MLPVLLVLLSSIALMNGQTISAVYEAIGEPVSLEKVMECAVSGMNQLATRYITLDNGCSWSAAKPSGQIVYRQSQLVSLFIIIILFHRLFLNSIVGFTLCVLPCTLYVCTELRDFLWVALF